MCKNVLVIIGTRPEAIKLAPVIYQLRAHPDEFRTRICNSGQHDAMIRQVLRDFGIKPDFNLDVMRPGQSLSRLSARLFEVLDDLIGREKPDWVIVQGDTTTTMVAALSCFYKKIKLAHVEAGLRSHDRFGPFPEEVNRRIVSLVTDLHFAPTEKAKQNLLREGVVEKDVRVTGNTAIDALLWMRKQNCGRDSDLPLCLRNAASNGRKLVLITGHRRESFGREFNQICLAIRDLAQRFDDAFFVYPVHLNPTVRRQVNRVLLNVERVFLLDPVSYREFVDLMDRSAMIMTDSGGIQEEAPSLGKPVLVMRKVTERPEAVDAGMNILVGTSRKAIVASASSILCAPPKNGKNGLMPNPYGDGKAARRIVEALRDSSV